MDRRRLPRFPHYLIATLVAACLAGTAVAQTAVLLDADFEDKDLGPIGTGGAAVDEPWNVGGSIDADVVAAGAVDQPMPTKSLRLTDQSTLSAQSVSWEFLNDAEPTRGTVTISFDLWLVGPLDELTTRYQVNVRENGGGARNFVSMDIDGSGLYVADASGAGAVWIADVVADRVLPFRLVFDMERLTYDVWVDGVEAASDRYHTIADRGVGGFRVGTGSDGDTGDQVYVDNILVTHHDPQPSSELLSADFEDKDVDLAIATGGAELGEPDAVIGILDAIVRDNGTSGRQLEIIDDDNLSNAAVVFDLLGDADIDTGVLRVRADLWFDQAETYRLVLLDATSSASASEALFVVSFLSAGARGGPLLEVTDQSSDDGGLAYQGDRYIIDRGRTIRLEAVIDLDTDLYSLTWDGEALVTDRGYAQPTRAFGRLAFLVDGDPGTGDSFHLDNLMVEDITPVPIFEDGFESGDTFAWQ